MKKTLTLLALLLLSITGAVGQKYQNNQAQPKYKYYQEMTHDETINNINEINISLQRYSKLQIGGEIAMISGTCLTILSSMSYANKPFDNGIAIFGMAFGGATAFVGYIVKLHSFSYLKKISIQGSSVVYKF